MQNFNDQNRISLLKIHSNMYEPNNKQCVVALYIFAFTASFGQRYRKTENTHIHMTELHLNRTHLHRNKEKYFAVYS